jgi:hypothetical protein
MGEGIPCILQLPDHWTKRAKFKVQIAVKRGGYAVEAGRWTDWASIRDVIRKGQRQGTVSKTGDGRPVLEI